MSISRLQFSPHTAYVVQFMSVEAVADAVLRSLPTDHWPYELRCMYIEFDGNIQAVASRLSFTSQLRDNPALIKRMRNLLVDACNGAIDHL